MWYHGTNQTIDKFSIDEAIQGISTQSFSAQGAVYFTRSPELASAYASMAARTLYPSDHCGTLAHLEGLSARYNTLMDQGEFDEADAVCMQLEEDEGALQGERSGEAIYPVFLTPKRILEVDFNGDHWSGDRVVKLMNLAQERQLDALVLRQVVDQPDMNTPMPSDICVVFNAEIIRPVLGCSLQERTALMKISLAEASPAPDDKISHLTITS